MTGRDADQNPDQNTGQNAQQPFVGAADRPQVGLHPDTPVSEMKVRDLQQLLGGSTSVTLKPVIQDTKLIIHEKNFKHEKWEHPKFEKFEKYEHLKWEKHEKHEWETFPPGPVNIPDPGPLASQLSALQAHVQQLGQQIEELKQKG